MSLQEAMARRDLAPKPAQQSGDELTTDDEQKSAMMYPGTRTSQYDSQPADGASVDTRQPGAYKQSKPGNLSLPSNNNMGTGRMMDGDKDSCSPTGQLAWLGLGCGVFGLACLCISFASPYWMQTYPNSFNQFQNIGLWEVCFYNYMHHKDDSQEIYNGCFWVLSEVTRYRKLREWLMQPWYISVQVMVTACLVAMIGGVVTMAMVFLHCCPVLNHEYHQTYAVFAAAALMFLVVLFTIISAGVFGAMCQDWEWMPRPDMNFLSWGYGFLLIAGVFAIISGICFYLEARRAYNALVREEEKYAKALEAYGEYSQMSQSAYGHMPSDVSGYYPPSYNGQGYTQDQYSAYSGQGYAGQDYGQGAGYTGQEYGGQGYPPEEYAAQPQGYGYNEGYSSSGSALPVKS